MAEPARHADYVVTPMGASGHRWLARSTPTARLQIAVIGLTEDEARDRFDAAWRSWCVLTGWAEHAS